MNRNTRPIIGQEAICPDGLGRVVSFDEIFPHEFVEVETYIHNRSCKWDWKNVTLIELKIQKERGV